MSAPEQTPPTAVPTPSSAPSSEPKVTTLHQGNLERQRELLKQKLAEKYVFSFNLSPRLFHPSVTDRDGRSGQAER